MPSAMLWQSWVREGISPEAKPIGSPNLEVSDSRAKINLFTLQNIQPQIFPYGNRKHISIDPFAFNLYKDTFLRFLDQ
jgi:hypothetical protein